MTCKTISVTVFIMVMVAVQVISSRNIDARGESHTMKEPVKVTELRQKLQRLHDALQNYDKRNMLSSKSSPSKDSYKETEQENQHDEDATVKPIPTQQQQLTTEDSHLAVHLGSRALKAEDMKKSLERDSDESDLHTLYQSKVRRDDDAAQILAKALAQLGDSPSHNGEDKTGAYLGKSKSEPEDNIDQLLASNGQTMESYILNALMRLDKGEEGGKEENHHPHSDQQQPLYRSKDVGRSEHQTKQKSPRKKQPAVVAGDLYANGADGSYTDEEIINALLASGYTTSGQESGQGVEIPQALEAVENRLIEDIQEANDLGLSVNDIIEDLEDKAFKEAIIERIHRIVGPR